MRCIVCGKGSGEDIYCSLNCQQRLNKGRSTSSLKILTSNLLQIRRKIQRMFDHDLHAESSELSEKELSLHQRIEMDYGLEKLADILIRDYNDTKETQKKIDLRGLQKDEELARRRGLGSRLPFIGIRISDYFGRTYYPVE